MTATSQVPELLRIEHALKQHLLATLPESVGWSVRCLVRQGMLIVLVQHPVSSPVDQRQVFGVLEAGLRRSPDLGLLGGRSPDLHAIRLYLRQAGQREPYGFYRFAWGAATPPPPPSSIPSSGLAASPATTFLAATAATTGAAHAADPATDADLEPDADRGADPTNRFLATRPPQVSAETNAASFPLGLPAAATNSHTPSRTMVNTVVDVEVSESRAVRQWSLASHPAARFGVAAGIAAGLMFLVGGGYVLSRPCVVGRCVPLESAQSYALDAAGKLEEGSTAQDVVSAYEALTEASYLLNRIPSWSGYYDTAQTLLTAYTVDIQKLERVVEAQRLAMDAAVQSQNPPHPITVWREIQQTWQGAIAQLAKVPADSPIYDLAQRKRAEYESNLAQIDQRIRREVEAQEWITVARKTAQTAEARQGVATTLGTWQQTRATWQTVIDYLKKIPTGTMAHAEGQQLLELYQPQLLTAEERVRQEEAGSQRFSLAAAAAAAAQDAERRDQWNEAAAQWQQALVEVQQIQDGSTAYDQAQPLISSYQMALNNAQNNVQVSTVMQAALTDMAAICGTNPRLCQAERAGDRIRVRLTEAYERALVAATGATPVSTARLDQMNPMLRAIATISETHTIPAALYEANGTLFGIYDPRIGGYVAELE